ncbi:TRAP transporter substrate-binding protein [Parasedimentitalea marina]|uniref:TRAP transporter substrate-binding protein n=1 Tax=Parasedimentitalea marina TaxID=2483033 RepID=A0A3T0N4G1_9RHOB|nr:TRAP transporter substrate-binding protein [Parasedimentitalea marina]AZV78905.1 TRAP transporter substrate-binding protein [Parasedimentitalea marina]
MTFTRRSALKVLGAASATAALATPGLAAGKITIQVNTTMKPGGSEEAGIARFKTALDELAPGRFDVVPFLSGQLGGENAVLELLNIGETQISLTGGNWRAQYAPEYDPISIPFLFPNGAAVEDFMATDSGKKLQERGKQQGGIVEMGAQMRAPRHMTANKSITTPDDLAGFRLRLPGIPVWVDIWSALGAQTVVVPATEIYLAMQTGQVDGHENSLVSPYSRKLYEVQSHLIKTGHVHFPWHWVASETWLSGLSDADQSAVRAAVQIARIEGSKVEVEKDKFYLAELRKAGMTVVEPDTAAFIAKAKPAIDSAMSSLADGVVADIQRAIFANS